MMQNIINLKFQEWTEGLAPKEARIRIFNEVRDIPYYLVPQVDDAFAWAASILEANKGSCSPKHYLLGFYFGKLGIPLRYITYPFEWKDQPIRYPQEIKGLLGGLPTGYHAACKVYLGEKWVLADATWDAALSRAGFPVNLGWDGLSETMNAVEPADEINHEELEGRLNFVRERKSVYSREEKEAYARFVPKFNSWLEEIRQKA